MHTLSVFDDFYPCPQALTITAKTLKYGPEEYKGHIYKGVGLGYKPENIWLYISMALNRPVKEEISFFRLGLETEMLNTYIHADAGSAVQAAVMYLSEAPEGITGGTALWKHKETGLSAIPTNEWIRLNMGDSDEVVANFWKKINEDGNDEGNWIMTDLIGQKFNRLVTYPTKMFHSRYPKQSWGTDINTGRLTWAAFLNLP